MLRRIFLGTPEHWLYLVLLAAALFAMGRGHLHVRAFSLFALSLLGLVALTLVLIVSRYRPGDDITREPLGEAVLPHTGPEEEEV